MNIKTIKPSRLCCVCDKQFSGRSDKVFCDYHCKNEYHAELRRRNKTATQANTKILARNYVILCELLGNDCEKYVIKKLRLKESGFSFDTISGISHTPYGLKFDVYEFSWYFSGKDNVVIRQDREQTKLSPYMYKRWERHLKPLQTDFLQ